MASRFEIIQTPLHGVKVLKRLPSRDNRGLLERLYCTEELSDIVGERKIAQVNHTLTASKGAVRGLHFQKKPKSEMKFISCIRGRVFDVAVDLRRSSSTYLKWHAEVLSESNFLTMVIPEGVAHGFQALTENCELIYLHTAIYTPSLEGGIHPNDPQVGIKWPLTIELLSNRDNSLPTIDAFISDF